MAISSLPSEQARARGEEPSESQGRVTAKVFIASATDWMNASDWFLVKLALSVVSDILPMVYALGRRAGRLRAGHARPLRGFG